MDNRSSRNKDADSPTLENVIEVWKKTVDVQQHFNDISLKIRSFLAIIVAAIITYVSHNAGSTAEITQPEMLLGSIALFLIIFSLYRMDRKHYYDLLISAVKHGKYIEGRYKENFPELGLARKISEDNPKEHVRKHLDIFYILLGIVALMPWIVFLFHLLCRCIAANQHNV